MDLKAAHQEVRAELEAAFQNVLDSGWYILGEAVERFESEFAEYCGVRNCVGVGNGLEALHLLLVAHGIGEGDEVIVPSDTYIATWLAISYAGAKPVPVEPERESFNLDPDRMEAAITAHTRAIMPVHLYGRISNMQAIMEIANRRNVIVIEDCAQAHGASQNSRSAGAFGFGAWSFYPTKNLAAIGDAGAVTTSDASIADKVRLLRNYGSRVRYYNEVRGFNSRLDPLQAAFLSVKLKRLNKWNQLRARVAQRYSKELAGVANLTLPGAGGPGESVWHQYVVRHPRRDALKAHLEKLGVATLIHYPIPPHLSLAYSDAGWKAGSFPIAEEMASTVLSLPIAPHMPDDAVSEVISAVKSFGS